MIIDARAVKSTTKTRCCTECDQHIWKGESLIRLYGAADSGDKPYALYLHLDCAEKTLPRRERAGSPCREIPGVDKILAAINKIKSAPATDSL